MEKQSLDEYADTLGQVVLAEDVVPSTLAATARRPAIVVDGVIGEHQVTVAPPENPKEGDHRRFLEKAKAIFGMVLFVVAVVIATCMMFLHSNDDVQKIGAGVIVAALSAAAGFAARGSK